MSYQLLLFSLFFYKWECCLYRILCCTHSFCCTWSKINFSFCHSPTRDALGLADDISLTSHCILGWGVGRGRLGSPVRLALHRITKLDMQVICELSASCWFPNDALIEVRACREVPNYILKPQRGLIFDMVRNEGFLNNNNCSQFIFFYFWISVSDWV